MQSVPRRYTQHFMLVDSWPTQVNFIAGCYNIVFIQYVEGLEYMEHVVFAHSVTLVMLSVYLCRRTSKSRSKREKKRWSLKEGSAHEEFALVEALWNLVDQTTACKGLQCLLYTVNHVYFASMKFSRFSRIEKNREIKYTRIFRNGPSP